MININLADETINTFKKTLSSKASVLTARDEGYKESLVRWSNTATRSARVVVQPASTEDVSKTVKFAVENALPFVVKGGGHACSGISSSEGLVIDLSKNINKVTVDKENKLITAGGGALWADVDNAAAEYGLAAVGGTVNHTGIGGLTLGGGYGFLSGQYGLTIDNLESAEIVTADGQIRNASKTENKDLFWAIRGYGKSFGVATSFVYRAYELTHPVFAGMIIFPGTKLEEVVSVLNEFMKTQVPQSEVLFVFKRSSPEGAASIGCLLFHNGTEEEANSIFAPLIALGPVFQETGMMPYKTVNTLQNMGATYGDRKRFSAANLKSLSYPIIKRAFDKYANLAEAIPDASRSICILELANPQGILQHAREEMAFNWRDTYINIAIVPRWTDPALDTTIKEWTVELQAIFYENGDGKRLYSNFTEGLTDVKNEVGSNYEKLKALKNEYDPSGVFPKV